MNPTIPRPIGTIKEIKTFIEDRQYYIDQGYSFANATQRAYDHLYVNRRNR
jgi:hypothetical protein